MMSTNADAIKKAAQEIDQRNSEIIALAARKVLGVESDLWRERVSARDEAVRKSVYGVMQKLGYDLMGSSALPQIESTQIDTKIQDVYIIKRWLDDNKTPSTSGPIIKRRNEFEALLDLNCYQLTGMMGIDPIDHQVLHERLFKNGHNINKPTQARKLH